MRAAKMDWTQKCDALVKSGQSKDNTCSTIMPGLYEARNQYLAKLPDPELYSAYLQYVNVEKCLNSTEVTDKSKCFPTPTDWTAKCDKLVKSNDIHKDSTCSTVMPKLHNEYIKYTKVEKCLSSTKDKSKCFPTTEELDDAS